MICFSVYEVNLGIGIRGICLGREMVELQKYVYIDNSEYVEISFFFSNGFIGDKLLNI